MVNIVVNRRALIAAGTAAIALSHHRAGAASSWGWGYPMGLPRERPGDGLVIRNAFATENPDYYAGAWHTGEDWYVLDGDAAGANVYACADGEIIYADFDYPGRVVIIRHADDLFSLYGHLHPDLAVSSGSVAAGDLLGTVLDRTDGRAESHLHFEMRTFLTTSEVNGASPRYEFACGVECPPGPGYWPMDAPEHPTAMGWLNPLEVIAARMSETWPANAEVIVPRVGTTALAITTEDGAATGDVVTVQPRDRFSLLGITAGDPAGHGTSAESTSVRYWIQTEPHGTVWVAAVVPSDDAFGSDGRPSSLRFALLPAVP